MRVDITGTTKGLGHAIADRLSRHDIKHYNRPEFDLARSVKSMVRTDWDVFINNAYHDWAQVDLLYALFEANRDRQCRIICISSVCADRLYDHVFPYSVHKKALDLACLQLQQINSQCRITNIKLGRLDTDMVSHRSGPKLDLRIVAEQIAQIAEAPYGPSLIKELTIDNHYG